MGLLVPFPVIMEENDDITLDDIERMVDDAPDVINRG